ncbi:TonB-dependent siderophore receptor [Sulfurovum sp.]|uniref:TonB-dependent receptor plug domain-containing protein n=1 Tax=Sulfurovum sp. TaxID=1969726 RepID=UPI0025E8B57C|nr:TonB-dependent receptor [Sulfurovum sp.]
MTTKTLSLMAAALLLTGNVYADETLEPITVVSANKTTQSVKDTTSNVTVITAEEIEENGYQTVAQAISHESGMIISKSGGMGQPASIFTRGMEGGQTLVLLDGMRLNDPSTPNGAAHLESLGTANIEQIEIIKGGQSSIWGSNASAGVINIITKTPKQGTHGSATIGYGSYNTKEVSTDIAYKDEKLMVQAMGSYLTTDGFSALAPRDAEKDAYENKTYNLKLGYVFNKNNKIDLSFNHIETDTQYDGSDVSYTPNPNDTTSYVTSEQKNYTLDYYFTYDNYSATLHANKGEYTREDYYNGQGPTFYNASTSEYSLINAYSYTQRKAVLGLEYKEIEDELSLSPQSSYINKAIFFSNLYRISDNTLLETNLRYDDYDAFSNKATYKIGLSHDHSFLEGFKISANYYTSYDAPTIYQYAPSTYVKTNPDLKPSYTKGFDITASYKKLISITYFNNKVEDYIDYESSAVWGQPGQYVNVDGESKFEGIEVAGSYTFDPYNLILSTNYTHLIKTEKYDGSDFMRRPKDVLNASLDYYTDSNMHFGINAQYIGDRTDLDYGNGAYDPITGTMIYPKVQTGNYTLWNLNFGAKIVEDLDLNINARNIFDKDYQSVYGYATEGRSVYAKIKYSF